MNIIEVNNELLSGEVTENIVTKLRSYLECINEENAKLESAIEELNLSNKLVSEYKSIESVQESINEDVINIAKIEKERTYRKNLNKLKTYTKLFTKLNENVESDLELVKLQIENSQKLFKSFEPLPINELEKLKTKTERYASEIKRIEKKHSWINDGEFDLKSIMMEVNKLNELKDERKRLSDEMNAYKGLQPNLRTAQMQLNDLKQEYYKIVNERD